MNSVEGFCKTSILEDARHDDGYHDKLEIIAGSEVYLNDFREVLKENLSSLNRRNILVVVSMLQELILNQAKLEALYPVILELMYKEASYDFSISPRIARVLIKIRGEDITVFKDITENTDESDPVSVSISVCALYSNYPNFEGIPEATISRFLEKVYICLRKNKGCNDLKLAISSNLLPILQKNDYMGYCGKFSEEGLN